MEKFAPPQLYTTDEVLPALRDLLSQHPAVRIGERSIQVNRRELERFLLETRRVVASSRAWSVRDRKEAIV